MNNMTGGSLPARTWHDIMAYAHQGVPLKHIVGMAPGPTGDATANIGAPIKTLELGAPQRPAALSKGAVEALGSIESKIKTLSLGKQGGAFEELAPLSAVRSHSASGGFRQPGGALE
jgi:penicillin-binding protein 1A